MLYDIEGNPIRYHPNLDPNEGFRIMHGVDYGPITKVTMVSVPEEINNYKNNYSSHNIDRMSIVKRKSDYTLEQQEAYAKGKAAVKKRTAKRKPARRRKTSYRRGGGSSRDVIYPNIVGRGSYFGDIGHSLGQSAGGYLGRIAGDAVGGLIEPFSGIAGLGDYHVNRNAILVDPPPVINMDPRGGVVVRHREYLGDIRTDLNTAGAFNIASYGINPGDERTFPWLSQIACNYEEYDMQGCVFEFRSMSANALNSTNTALGTVIMATQYNAASDPFESKAQMENYQYGCSSKPSENLMHPIECEPRQTVLGNLLYTRGGAIPAGDDPRLFDLGNFSIATQGGQATNVNLGELWVTYQVCLLKPKLYSFLGNDINAYYMTNAAATATDPLGANASDVVTLNNFPNFRAAAVTGGFNSPHSNSTQIALPNSAQFAYQIEVYWGGTIAAAVVVPVLTLTRCAYVDYGVGTAGSTQVPASGVSSIYVIQKFSILTDGSNQTALVVFGVAGTLPTGTTAMRLTITQLPADQF
ncbi:capsid protein [Crucivirus-99]|nr:capsid protein [Crucivirus-99]